MPIVQIDLLEGRSLEQKRALVEKVTDAVCETAKCSKEAVIVILREAPTEHIGKAGQLMYDMKK